MCLNFRSASTCRWSPPAIRPFAPSRYFRRVCSVNRRSTSAPIPAIKDPKDLAGRQVGIPEWAQTAGIYARGYLQHHCGVRLEDIRWVQAGVNEPGRKEKVSLSLPSGVSIRPCSGPVAQPDASRRRDRRRDYCSRAGRFRKGRSAYRAALAQLAAARRSVLRRDGVFPIMHVIAIKSAVLERYPWVAMNLYKALMNRRQMRCGTWAVPSPRAFPSPGLTMPWRTPRKCWPGLLALWH